MLGQRRVGSVPASSESECVVEFHTGKGGRSLTVCGQVSRRCPSRACSCHPFPWREKGGNTASAAFLSSGIDPSRSSDRNSYSRSAVQDPSGWIDRRPDAQTRPRLTAFSGLGWFLLLLGETKVERSRKEYSSGREPVVPARPARPPPAGGTPCRALRRTRFVPAQKPAIIGPAAGVSYIGQVPADTGSQTCSVPDP